MLENIERNELLDYGKMRISYEVQQVLNYMEHQHIEICIY